VSNVKKGNREPLRLPLRPSALKNSTLPDLMSDREGSGGLRRIEHLAVISLIKYSPNPPYNYNKEKGLVGYGG